MNLPAPQSGPAGVVHYDGECALCRAWVARWAPRLAARGYVFQPMQSEASRQVLGLAPGELAGEMKLTLPDGGMLGGIHAVAALYPELFLGLAALGSHPHARPAAARRGRLPDHRPPSPSSVRRPGAAPRLPDNHRNPAPFRT